ncbi:shikimate dehydrogenase [Cumulibacter soli]|uniref:shikimate dehydrogenase n=1 Tax=Cumulibacter soli TaxID=2546344 RepID=UPI0010686FE1|nr:shikimate dehydrogenase [Cumulibacter soli]
MQPRVCAVIGSPIDHSLSPALHTAAYADLGLPWRYTRRDVPAGELGRFVDALSVDGIDDLACGGLSVTMPGKAEALARADERDPRAVVLGAANTLVPRFDNETVVGWSAYNTDVDGIIGAFAQHGLTQAASKRCVIIGAGGTAAAALAALRAMGAQSVAVVARNLAKAAGLSATGEQLDIRVDLVSFAAAAAAIRQADVITSTVPPGVADAIARHGLRAGQMVLDAVYAGGETALLRQARTDGATAVGGVHMLLHQAVEQVRLMTGLRPSVEAMRAALP